MELRSRRRLSVSKIDGKPLNLDAEQKLL